ncbi:ABC transporter substrate-binding protein [Hydrogenibacillus sp. N12]|uniref:ABC transporter substrate-binding protein n=1 Tax=Hydrogenibacillus sp. N12 TaxID=2866627 RepID=UPI001C7D1392|nr:ABC transporter substrate-binding protein [Hydrogenibacillus sp. N12]QZA32586.1 ABC transporter substrate-binding protein [Hydrogenibacillus sp. N12]
MTRRHRSFRWAALAAAFVLAFTLAACSSGSKEGAQEGKSTLDLIQERGKLIAGVKYDTPLMGYKNPKTGEVEGFDVDIAKALAKKILGDENKIELKEVTSSTRIPMLKNGDIDIIVATMTITDERKKEINFSDVYYTAGQSLLVPKGSPIRGIEDLNENTKVAGVKGSTSVKNIREKAPKAQVLEYDNYAEAFAALKSGKVDAMTTDNIILMGYAQQDPNFELVGGLFTKEPYGIGIRKGDEKFTQYVNDFLKELKESGQYAELYRKWFKEEPPAE